MSLFSSTDLLKVAIQMERNGEDFYSRAADKMSDQRSRAILSTLARDEVEHRDRFERMLGDIELEPTAESYAGEYQAYLEAHVKSQVFTKERMEHLLAEQAPAPRAALLFAIDSEKDAILYYSEMKRIIHAKAHPVIDAIIREERGHLSKLVELMARAD